MKLLTRGKSLIASTLKDIRIRLKRDSSINHFTRVVRRHHLDAGIRVVMELALEAGLQAVEFAKTYRKARVFAFECNPLTLPVCYKNTATYSNVIIVPKAVNNYDGNCDFFPIDPKATDQERRKTQDYAQFNKVYVGRMPLDTFYAGASSIFKLNNKDMHPGYIQTDGACVPCVRLDTFCRQESIPAPDLLWMDLQGAEMRALESLGQLLSKVKAIHTEVIFRTDIYEGNCTYEDIDKFLNGMGFRRTWLDDKTYSWFGDAIYLNTTMLH